MSHSSMRRLTKGEYKIEILPAIYVPFERHLSLFAFACALAWIVWLAYMVSQLCWIWCLVVNEKGSKVALWTVALAESCLTFPDLVLAIDHFVGLMALEKRTKRARYHLIGQYAPSVDIFITCCGESTDVIVDTVHAAMAQDYPCDQFRVFVLDDGGSKDLKSVIESIRSSTNKQDAPTIEYLSRELKPGTRSFFKAGNINFGIRESANRGSSEFTAGLDADMIPDPNWLRRMIPEHILNDSVGMTVCPQNYYNVPPGDPLGQQAAFSMGFTVQEVLHDALDSAMCTGTGYIARRKALDSIGGWPLAETGEDYMCSALLNGEGWKVVLVRDNLQYGLCPESFRALIKQRMRWTDASMEVHKRFGYYFLPQSIPTQMATSQKLANLMYAIWDSAPVGSVFALTVLPFALVLSSHVTIRLPAQQLNGLARIRHLYLASLILNKLYTFLAYRHIGLSRAWRYQSNEIWAAPYMAFRCLASLLPESMNIPTFVVCGSIPASERSRRHRPSFWARVSNGHMLMFLTYLLYGSIPLIRLSIDKRNGHIKDMLLLPGPWVKLVGAVLKVLVPIWYFIWPPDMPERRILLEAESDGVRRPKAENKNNDRGEFLWWACVTGVEILTISLTKAY